VKRAIAFALFNKYSRAARNTEPVGACARGEIKGLQPRANARLLDLAT
jgi:hypothetical protein